MQLSYKKFIEKIKNDVWIIIKENINDYELQNTYTLSYVAGGSCWTNDPQYYSVVCEPSDSERDFSELTTLLDKFFPNIKYKEYKEIEKLIRHDTDTEFEYYGNSTTSAIQTIKLLDIYTKLSEYGYV